MKNPDLIEDLAKTDPMSPAERGFQMADNAQRAARKYNKPMLLAVAEDMGIANPYGVPPVGNWTKIMIAEAIYLKFWQEEYAKK